MNRIFLVPHWMCSFLCLQDAEKASRSSLTVKNVSLVRVYAYKLFKINMSSMHAVWPDLFSWESTPALRLQPQFSSSLPLIGCHFNKVWVLIFQITVSSQRAQWLCLILLLNAQQLPGHTIHKITRNHEINPLFYWINSFRFLFMFIHPTTSTVMVGRHFQIVNILII